MKRFEFTGEDPVDVPSLALADVQPGQVIEVTDEQAAGLDGQSKWKPVRAKKES